MHRHSNKYSSSCRRTSSNNTCSCSNRATRIRFIRYEAELGTATCINCIKCCKCNSIMNCKRIVADLECRISAMERIIWVIIGSLSCGCSTAKQWRSLAASEETRDSESPRRIARLPRDETGTEGCNAKHRALRHIESRGERSMYGNNERMRIRCVGNT